MRKIWAILLLLTAGTVAAQTYNTNIIPAQTGLDLGKSNQRWDAFIKDIDINGTCKVNGVVASCLGATNATSIQGHPVSPTVPLLNQCLVFNGQTWAPATCPGGGGGGGGTPGGQSGNVQINQGGQFAGIVNAAPNFVLHGGNTPSWGQVNLNAGGDTTGVLPVNNGGNGTSSPGLVAGTNITISGTWPTQTVNSTATSTPPGGNGNIIFNNAGAFGAISNGTSGQVLHGGSSPVMTGINFSTDTFSGILTSALGGTSNGFTAFSGPASSAKTFILPNANSTILTSNAAVTVPQGGTGATTANAGLNNLLPTQTANATKVLTTDGTNTAWQAAGTGNTTSTALTTNILPRSNGANSVIDSHITDNGSTVSISLPITISSTGAGSAAMVQGAETQPVAQSIRYSANSTEPAAGATIIMPQTMTQGLVNWLTSTAATGTTTCCTSGGVSTIVLSTAGTYPANEFPINGTGPACTISGAGTGATCHSTMDGSTGTTVASLTLDTAGSGYSGTPTVAIDNPALMSILAPGANNNCATSNGTIWQSVACPSGGGGSGTVSANNDAAGNPAYYVAAGGSTTVNDYPAMIMSLTSPDIRLNQITDGDIGIKLVRKTNASPSSAAAIQVRNATDGASLWTIDWATGNVQQQGNLTANIGGTATLTVPVSSPTFQLCGDTMHSSASVQSCAVMQETYGVGNDAAVTVTLANNSTSTGTVTFQTPSLIAVPGTSTGTVTLTSQATAGTPTLTFPNTSGTFAASVTGALALSATTGQLSITGAAGQVLAGSTPAFTATPVLGTDNTTAGTVQMANASANAHTTWGSAATTSNNILGPATRPTVGDVLECDPSSPASTCTLFDTGFLGANVVRAVSPGVGIAHFAGSTQVVTSSAVNLAGADVTGTLPIASVAAAATVFNSGTIVVPSGNYVIVGCTSTCSVPVPVPAAGYQICVKNDAGITTVITLSALGSSAMYPKSDDSGYGTAGTGTMVSTAASGNKVCLIGRDSTHYELGAINASANWTVN